MSWIVYYIFITDHMFCVLAYGIELVNRFILDAGLVCNDYRTMDRNYVSYNLKVKFMDFLLWKHGGRRHSLCEATWFLQ